MTQAAATGSVGGDQGVSRGRPRDPALDEAILDATASLLAEAGFDGLTMEQVASHAGVSKASLYRRFANRSDLLAATCEAFAPESPPTPDTGSSHADAAILLTHFAQAISDPSTGGPLRAILAASRANEDARQALKRFSSNRRAPLREIAERAVKRGELPPDTDPDVVADLLAGAVLYRTLVRDDHVGDERINAYVGLVLPERSAH